ncbi:MAG: hypothetical protein GYB31_05985 [Bacteroidetes bacterium]|nr:hypothetical protein [Bacteroidota bacterium]
MSIVIRSSRLLPFLLLTGLFFFGGCKAIETAVERGIRQAGESLQEEEAGLSEISQSISEAAVRSAMATLANDSLNTAIREEWEATLDSLLKHFGDSLQTNGSQLISELLGQKTDSLLQARIQTLGTSFIESYARLEPEIRASLNRIIQQDINQGLQQILANLRNQLNSDETYGSLELFRQELARQIDSLLYSSINATSQYTEVLIVPQVDDIASRVEGVGTTTQKKASNIIWLIVLGGAALLFLGGLIRLYLQQQKYREMVKVFTAKIDSIEQQPVYDKLVGRITNEMKNKDLEDNLREILEEQDLIIQPEWEDKDYQVNRLLLSQLKDAAEGEAVDRETWIKALFQKARELDLEDHLKSVINRKE